MSEFPKSPRSLEQELNLPPAKSREDTQKELVQGILGFLVTQDHPLKDKISSLGLWKDVVPDFPPPLLVSWEGAPQNPDEVFRDAAKEVASLLGLRFLQGVQLDQAQQIDPQKDFVFLEVNSAPIAWVDAVKGNNPGLLTQNFQKLQQASCGLLALNNTLEADVSQQIADIYKQTFMLRFVEERKVDDQSYPYVYMGLSGRLSKDAERAQIPVSFQNRFNVQVCPKPDYSTITTSGASFQAAAQNRRESGAGPVAGNKNSLA